MGKYQLLRRLATGGMAELFLARAAAMHGFEKLVVLKRILPQHAESDDFIKMFLTEARLAATLHHPNIVQVYDIGEDQGHHFFTMEWVQGQDLRKLVRAARKTGTAIPLEHILHVITGVAAGLDYAHDKTGLDGQALGVVHRDVSPSNVLVTYDGAVKLVDFGIAKAAAFQSNTVAGTLKGKIPYMSPEQCRGEPVDRRSDIFSIGTLLWELTTGTRLFAGDNEIAIINRVAQGDVPLPSSVRPDYPAELERIVMRALHADPLQRYQRAVDMQIDLEDFAREARLPVSSARVAKFMRELFAEEMQQTAAQIQAERFEAANSGQAPIAVVPESHSEATSVDGIEASEVPSELRLRTPTPRVESAVSRSTLTQSEGPTRALGPDELPPPSRARWWIGAAAAVVAAVGLGGAYAWATSGAADDRAAAAGPPVVLRAEVPPEITAPTPTPAAPPVVLVPAPVRVETPAGPAGDATPPVAPSPTLAAEDEPAVVLEGADAERPGDKPKQATPAGKTTRKPPKPAEPKKPPATEPKKPKWDPDSPMPPM
ncbi:MAG: serine/threonine protein kinase [Nannocystaceae bacterium]|nr:serine/threonine protein kinase [Nannocystaceae bacterium]